MRVVALVAAHNEERFIGGCLEHLAGHGVEVFLLDNESTDRTVEIAERWRGRGLMGVETIPRSGMHRWRPTLERKARLAADLPGDWFIHLDPDEVRLPPDPGQTLAEALAEADAAGFDAVNFLEYVFVPTRESPDHDHADFQRTMRWYYPFRPFPRHRLNAWKRQPEPVDLATSGGHVVAFPGIRPCPRSFPMRHYLYLSADHARRKYVERVYDPAAVAQGWHGRRGSLRPQDIVLLPAAELRPYRSDAELDASEPRRRHPVFAEPPVRPGAGRPRPRPPSTG